MLCAGAHRIVPCHLESCHHARGIAALNNNKKTLRQCHGETAEEKKSLCSDLESRLHFALDPANLVADHGYFYSYYY